MFAGRYRVIRRLGTGGSASVFLAQDERLGREVAIKRLHGAEATPHTAQRLQREARIMASLDHPNLVTLYDMLIEEDDLLLVMEYVPGETLREVLNAAPLGWDRTLALLEPVADALDHVHRHGVVHRDLKPSNILAGSDGTVKVADLGLATAAEITNITPPGTIVGTPAYMAPEQARAGPCTPAVDIYALASIAFYALSGTLPRTGGTVVAVLTQATREPPPDLRTRRPGTPAAAAEVLMRGMSPWPEERQRSASQLLHELDSGCRPRPAPPVPPPHSPEPPRGRPARPRNRRARMLAITALVAAAAAAVVIAMALASTDPKPSPASPARTTPAGPEATATATPSAPRSLSATATVRAFYRRAAAGEYRASWQLAGPAMRGAFGNSYERYRTDMASLRRIEFRRLAVQRRDAGSVTVAIETVATHTDHVDQCSGTLRTVRGDGGEWVVEPTDVACISR
jgi:serine/threonine protein kinase